MAKRDWHILAKEQRIGAIILLSIGLAVWLFMAIWQSRHPEPGTPDKPQKKSWAERKDSIRLADSTRYAQWQEEQEQRYDSFRTAQHKRHEEFREEMQQFWDSTRAADSLWRDSVGIRYVKREKKDTILDLNHCDTTELQYIRGIGHYTAVKIVKYRTQLGGYYSPEQLKDEELADRHLDTLLYRFTANPKDVQTLNVNACVAEVLARHPYLRYNQAKAIYTLRRKKVRLKSMDDLRSLPELTENDLNRLAPYLRFD